MDISNPKWLLSQALPIEQFNQMGAIPLYAVMWCVIIQTLEDFLFNFEDLKKQSHIWK